MKVKVIKSLSLLTVSFLFTLLFVLPSYANRIRHPFKDLRKRQALNEKADEIPMYEKGYPIQRDYKEIQLINVQDAFTKKREPIYLKMRREALKVGADAIVEVDCKVFGKMIALNCYGYAVKWK